MSSRPRLLVLEEDWRSVSSDLAAAGCMLEPVIMDLHCKLWLDGRLVNIGEADPAIGWFSPELFYRNLDDEYLAHLRAAPGLQWLQVGRAGVDYPVLPELAARGVRITSSNAPAASIAEYVLHAVLDVLQRGPERRTAQCAAEWRKLPFREMLGTRWVIFGFGSIGREVGKRAQPFGARVLGVRRRGGSDAAADEVLTPGEAGPALAAADVVVVALPLNGDTCDSIGADFFQSLKPGAIFLNVGRGALVDEEALKATLDEGRVGHAVLDVMRTEPLPADHWLWRHPRVTITAHTSSMGSGLMARTREIFVRNVRRFLAGEPLELEVQFTGAAGAPAHASRSD